jgi:ATP-binding cassette, subfamily C (CFTR/MRP), member 1
MIQRLTPVSRSGKSSLLLALLRLLDLSTGSITIDGIDISTLPREELRSRLIVISQESFALPGTVRQNVDPYAASTPEMIEHALRRVGLWDAIQEKGGLEKAFGEDMLSHGQRQLFSLARAILRKDIGKVVLLDEVTSR